MIHGKKRLLKYLKIYLNTDLQIYFNTNLQIILLEHQNNYVDRSNRLLKY